MTRTLIGLMREARAIASWRGHHLRSWTGLQWNRHNTREAYCKDCGRSVTVSLKPYPNEADIMEEAVAVNCNSCQNKEGR